MTEEFIRDSRLKVYICSSPAWFIITLDIPTGALIDNLRIPVVTFFLVVLFAGVTVAVATGLCSYIVSLFLELRVFVIWIFWGANINRYSGEFRVKKAAYTNKLV